MVEDVLGKLCTLFEQGGARFRVLRHEPCNGTSEDVARIRGTAIGQGAKALVCQVKGNGVKQYVLAVLPADMQADLAQLAAGLGGRRAGLVSPAEVLELTGCIPGAVPPASLHEKLLGVCDPRLFGRFEEIAFNAGDRGVSIVIDAGDFRRIVRPREIAFARAAQ
ncbi:MAG: YbaK/prolyl-tRNA synthetase associated domain-containing protein [Duodenibacillus sp.]|nr:YbaK/prolyl-tRNA synthetase associated domain-containing protein [Duodenibacillus sp.]